ncbi:hypothetical protein EW145_g2964 [Phellinidium pouzarii]|uniref:F-box domain-containing protein n=1 Tax=Phellinidium pouzarii TaxID=167371 RepID=A0A4S4L942_9AGAM|nr:hypothetical protein EW145_g2964 [Phellinidium pouzarii]
MSFEPGRLYLRLDPFFQYWNIEIILQSQNARMLSRIYFCICRPPDRARADSLVLFSLHRHHIATAVTPSAVKQVVCLQKMLPRTVKRFSQLFKTTRSSENDAVKWAALDEDLYGNPQIIFSASPLPALPIEIWYHILAFVCRVPGTLSVSLPDPFQAGTQISDNRKQQRDSQRGACALQLVCRAWRSAAVRLTYERLVLCCEKHMKPLVEVLEKSKLRDTKERGYGYWVREVESRRGSCPSKAGNNAALIQAEVRSHVTISIRVLHCTQHLQIYINKNGWGKPLGQITYKFVLVALGKHCGASLQRLEWAASESPRWEDLRSLIQMTPYLRSLSLLHVAFKQSQVDSPLLTEKPCYLRYLQELRLGPFPTPFGASIPHWDELLSFLMPPKKQSSFQHISSEDCDLQLPALHSLSITPLNFLARDRPTERFFTIYGSRIRHIQTSNMTPKDVLTLAESAAVVQNRALRTLLALCPDLRSLVFNPLQPTQLPLAHARLERVALFPPHENHVNVPRRMFTALIQKPVDNIFSELLSGAFPNLRVLRLRDLGALACLGSSQSGDWIEEWGEKLEEQGIRFENRNGMRFMLTIEDSMEAMPDGV